MEEAQLVLEARSVSKQFAGKTVVSDVDLGVRRGEILALLGENGAGKSTLKNMLSGLLSPSSGAVCFEGRDIATLRPGELQVSCVHQELSLFLSMSVAENICIRSLPGRYAVSWSECRTRALAALEFISADIDPDALVSTLGPGERQLVEIAKALQEKPQVLILDEPTASLTLPEREQLFTVMRELKKRGIAMIFITHFMDEVFAICDKVCVLRNGRQVGLVDIGNASRGEIEEWMVGRALSSAQIDIGVPTDTTILRVDSLQSDRFVDISLEVRAGEILGVAGLIGAGRSELLGSIFGLRDADGRIELRGERVERCGAPAMIRKGVALVPEDRKNDGIFAIRSVRENMSAAALWKFVRRVVPGFGFRGESAVAAELVRKLSVASPGLEAPIMTLSGGNQQKVILGRWLAAEPTLFLLDDPTRGVDIGAKQEISELVARLARQGAAVILVSSDINELTLLAHRIVVMRKGRLVAEFPREAFDPRAIVVAASSASQH